MYKADLHHTVYSSNIANTHTHTHAAKNSDKEFLYEKNCRFHRHFRIQLPIDLLRFKIGMGRDKDLEDIKALELVKDAVIKEDGQVVSVEVENEEDFEKVMDRVVNIFRRIDDKSEVSYKFGLNRE